MEPDPSKDDPVIWAESQLAEPTSMEPTKGLEVAFGIHEDLPGVLGRYAERWARKKEVQPEACDYHELAQSIKWYRTWCPDARIYQDDMTGQIFISQPLQEGGEMIYVVDHAMLFDWHDRTAHQVPLCQVIYARNGKQFAIMEHPCFENMPVVLHVRDKQDVNEIDRPDESCDGLSFRASGKSVVSIGAFSSIHGLFAMFHECGAI